MPFILHFYIENDITFKYMKIKHLNDILITVLVIMDCKHYIGIITKECISYPYITAVDIACGIPDRFPEYGIKTRPYSLCFFLLYSL